MYTWVAHGRGACSFDLVLALLPFLQPTSSVLLYRRRLAGHVYGVAAESTIAASRFPFSLLLSAFLLWCLNSILPFGIY